MCTGIYQDVEHSLLIGTGHSRADLEMELAVIPYLADMPLLKNATVTEQLERGLFELDEEVIPWILP